MHIVYSCKPERETGGECRRRKQYHGRGGGTNGLAHNIIGDLCTSGRTERTVCDRRRLRDALSTCVAVARSLFIPRPAEKWTRRLRPGNVPKGRVPAIYDSAWLAGDWG